VSSCTGVRALKEQIIPYIFNNALIKNQISLKLEEKELNYTIKYNVKEFGILRDIIKYQTNLKKIQPKISTRPDLQRGCHNFGAF